MLKFLAVADSHIGLKRHGKINVATQVHTRIEDAIRSLELVCKIALREKVDFVSILGDVFNIKTPSNTERDLFINVIQPLFGKIPLYIFPGNHDKESLSHALSSLKVLGSANGVHIIDQPEIIRIKDVNLIFLPWEKNGEMSKYVNSIKDTKDSILFGHFITTNAVYSNGFKPDVGDEVVLLSLLENSELITTLIGHVHKKQTLGKKKNIHYIGSLVKWDWSEMGEDKGCTLVEVKDNKAELTFISIQDRTFIEVDYKDIDKLIKTDIADAVVKITGKCKLSEKGSIDMSELKKKLVGKCFKVEDIKIEFERDDVDKSNNQVFTPLLSTKEALVNWAANNKLDKEFVDKGLKIIESVE